MAQRGMCQYVIKQYSEWRGAVFSKIIKMWLRRGGYLWPLQRWTVSSCPRGSTSRTLRQEETRRYLNRDNNVDLCGHGNSHVHCRHRYWSNRHLSSGSYLSEVWRRNVSQLLVPRLARYLPPLRPGSRWDLAPTGRTARRPLSSVVSHNKASVFHNRCF